MIQYIKRHPMLFLALATVALLASCASMASPTGGEIDLDAPVVIRSSPTFNETGVKKTKISIEFDELVVIENPSEKVIITPPQTIPPIIRSANNKVYVELKDSLVPNTTYTIDFTDAIADNNEKNILENFSFSFATGDHVDTLCISGKVLSANNLEPVKGIYVGLHSNLSDTAFTKIPFLRISRTNDAGQFTIRGIAPGHYKVYALADANRDYMFDNPSENLAFLDAIVEPSTEPTSHADTLFSIVKGVHRIDSIKQTPSTRFLPDNLVLRAFSSTFKRQYLTDYDRKGKQLSIYFNAATDMPTIQPIDSRMDKNWGILEKSLHNDTLSYWIQNPEMLAKDSLSFEIKYLKTDSLNQAVLVTDTLHFVDRTRTKPKKEEPKKKGKEEAIQFLTISSNLASTLDVYAPITLEFQEPIRDSLFAHIKLQQLVDTVLTDVKFTLDQDSLNPRKFVLKHKWGYGQDYKIAIDSASIHSIYGLWNNKLEQQFRIKKEEEYAQLAISVQGIADSIPAFIELLDKSDKVVRSAKVKIRVALFKNLTPGQYYFRIILDENNNGVWDTGDYASKKQPEMVYYYTTALELRTNSEVEQDWLIDPTSLASQKPLEITKNKPMDKLSKRKQLEEEAKKNTQQKQNTNRIQPNSSPNSIGSSGLRQ